VSAQIKETFLSGLRAQWKSMVAQKFQGDTEKLTKADLKELSEDAVGSPLLKKVFRAFGVEASDIEKIMVECRDELLKESKNGEV